MEREEKNRMTVMKVIAPRNVGRIKKGQALLCADVSERKRWGKIVRTPGYYILNPWKQKMSTLTNGELVRSKELPKEGLFVIGLWDEMISN